ncbi:MULTISPECIES: hypothetical protein [Bacillus]|nr:hypothetical protein [Bacillus wiedmannii]MCU5096254.1 hypothetical protein [Bacillus wiedmannii]MCU5516623.1 hypothetical protein [Bacillus wiedmannii]MCU5706553.1 hypothetical protein [Bacillus wiedmannii]SCN10152.1 Protein of unknown function [Bacillus wiedmannii]
MNKTKLFIGSSLIASLSTSVFPNSLVTITRQYKENLVCTNGW